MNAYEVTWPVRRGRWCGKTSQWGGWDRGTLLIEWVNLHRLH